MKRPVPYTYVVACQRRRSQSRWALSIHLPNGIIETLTSYRSRAKAIAAARLLACDISRVEIRA